jgi:hypothetical protein
LPAAKDRFGFNQRTFAEPHGNDAFAPTAVIRSAGMCGGSCPNAVIQVGAKECLSWGEKAEVGRHGTSYPIL